MKWIGILVVALLLGGSWLMFSNTGGKMKGLSAKVEALQDAGDPEGEIPKIESEINSLDGQKTLNGILLAFLSAGFVGILFVVFVLPAWAERVTTSVYDSGEEIEQTAMHEARSLVAQGDFEGAVEAFRRAAAEEPGNRVPWVEMAKIQKQQLEDPLGGIETMKAGLESQEWPEDDAAFFLFRLAEMYNEDADDRTSGAGMLRQVMERFPETRHAANARHKLTEWGMV